jgi:hypothetical protein
MSNVFIKGGDTIEVFVHDVDVDESIPGVGDVLQLIFIPASGGSSNRCFAKAGVGAQTATAADYPLLGEHIQYLFIGFDADTIAFRSPNADGNVLVTRGSIR